MATLTCGYDAAGNAKTYTTFTAAYAAATAGDTIQVFYYDTRKGTIHDIGQIVISKAITIEGMIRQQQVTFGSQDVGFNLQADCTISNVTVIAAAYPVLTTSTEGIACTFNRCRFYGSRASYQTVGTLTLNNCIGLAVSASVFYAVGGTLNCNFCLAIGGLGYGAGFFNNGGTMSLKNCVSVCPTNGYAYITAAGSTSGSNCAGPDGTASNVGSNSVNTATTNPKFYKDLTSPLCDGYDYRIDDGSSLAGAGVAVSGISVDLLGRTRADPPSIGPYEVWPVATTLDADEVQGGKVFITPDGTEVEGTYTGIEPTDVPAAPVVESVTVTGTSVEIAFTIATQTDKVYLRYRSVNGNGDWSAESESLKTTGDGSILVEDLDPSVRYEFILYGKRAGFAGPWSVPVFAEAMTVGNGLPTYFDQAMLSTMAATVQSLWTSVDEGIAPDLASVKAKTDNLPDSPAAVSDIPTASQNASELLGTSIGRPSVTVEEALLSGAPTVEEIAAGVPTLIQIAEAVDDALEAPCSSANTGLRKKVVELHQVAGLDSTNPVAATGDGISAKVLTVEGMTVTITPDGITRT